MVEFGPPIRVPEELAELYRSSKGGEGRREAYKQVRDCWEIYICVCVYNI